MDNLRIMLACNAGLSTSLVVSRMQEYAASQGKHYKIWAVDHESISLELGNFDVLLLGPQIRHMLRRITREVGDQAVVDMIEPMSYGRCDGAAVVRQAEKLYENKKAK